MCSLFPKKGDLGGIERTALSIGLSLTVVPLMGLVLNYTPWGIKLYPTVLLLFGFTFIMSTVTVYRRRTLPVKERFSLSFRVNVRALDRSNRLILGGFIVFIVVTGGFIVYFVSVPKIGERFTEFYILGRGGKLEDYPSNITLGESSTVVLGVDNHEYEECVYNVIIRLENETTWTIEDIRLNHENEWTQNYTFTPQKAGEKMKLEFLLYKDDGEEPYRILHLWVSVKS